MSVMLFHVRNIIAVIITLWKLRTEMLFLNTEIFKSRLVSNILVQAIIVTHVGHVIIFIL